MFLRFFDRRIWESLEDIRNVLIRVPRQSGKTTHGAADCPRRHCLGRHHAQGRVESPRRIRAWFHRAVVDEVRRTPGEILTNKATVDADPRSRLFLLTGSAGPVTMPHVTDSLAGPHGNRPFAGPCPGRTARRGPRLSRHGVRADQPVAFRTPVVGESLVETVLAGGYPEGLTRSGRRCRRDWRLD